MHQEKEITKTVYNNIMNSIKVYTKWTLYFMNSVKMIYTEKEVICCFIKFQDILHMQKDKKGHTKTVMIKY